MLGLLPVVGLQVPVVADHGDRMLSGLSSSLQDLIRLDSLHISKPAIATRFGVEGRLI